MADNTGVHEWNLLLWGRGGACITAAAAAEWAAAAAGWCSPWEPLLLDGPLLWWCLHGHGSSQTTGTVWLSVNGWAAVRCTAADRCVKHGASSKALPGLQGEQGAWVLAAVAQMLT